MATSRRDRIPPSTRPTRSASTSLSALLEEHGMIMLYDGYCGLCNGTVQWLLRHDHGGTMRFAPLTSAIGREALARLPELEGVDSVVLLHKEGAWVKSTAILEMLRYVGGIWSFATVGYLFPRGLRDWFYDFVARRRYGWFGKFDSCPLPTPEQSARFLMRGSSQ